MSPQIEKCREVQHGYETKQVCDTWPKQVCELVKKNVTRSTPQTSVRDKKDNKREKEKCADVRDKKETRRKRKKLV